MGDFTTRSNALETVYRRVNPHDWDGDGLANEIDANPRMWDGDFFGTGVGWLNANCAGVLSAATNGLGEMEISWRTNANPNAYYWLDLTATGALGGFVENIYMKDCSVGGARDAHPLPR